MTGSEILEQVVALLGEVPEGDEAEELCGKLRVWLEVTLRRASVAGGPRTVGK